MERRGRPARIELGVAPHRFLRRQRLDLDAALLQLVEHLRVGTELAVRPRPDDHVRRELLEHLIQVCEYETVALGSPLVREHALGQDDHVLRLLLTVHGDAAEAIPLDTRQQWTLASAKVRGPAIEVSE